MDVSVFTTDRIELKEENDNSYVYGYISTKDKDLVNDIVTDNCMKSMFNQMKSRAIKFDIEHESFRGETDKEIQLNKTLNPIARVEWFGLDNDGLMTKSLLNKHHQRYDEVKGSIKDGFLDAFSIAYIPIKTWKEEVKGETIRKLDDINILNVAFTGNPINENARMTEVFMKSLDVIKNQEEIKMEEEKKEDAKPKEDVEVKGLEEKLTEISASLKSINERVGALEKKDEEGEDAEGEKPEGEKPVEAAPDEEKETLKTEVKELRKDVNNIKKSPQYKAVQGDMKKELAGHEAKSFTPLDIIR